VNQIQTLCFRRCIAAVIFASLLHAGTGLAQELSEEYRAAISSIEKLGAKVTVRNVSGSISTEVFLSDNLCKNIGKAVSLLPTLPNCRSIVSYWATITDDELETIGKLRNLEILKLSDPFTGRSSEITDEGLRHLRHLNQLRNLSLANTRITNNGLIHLRNLRRLEEIDISQTKIGSEGIFHLLDLATLKTLDLSNTAIDDAGLVHIGKLRQLESLAITGTQVSGIEFANLQRLEKLVDFELDSTLVTDLTCHKIAGLQHLTRLSLNDTRITDGAAKQLVELVHLKTLALDWTFVSDDGAKTIKDALPNVQIQIGTRLPDRDVASIKRLLKTKHDFEGEILGMDVLDSGETEVMTGEINGPLSGGGRIFRLRKTDGKWRVVGSSSWVS